MSLNTTKIYTWDYRIENRIYLCTLYTIILLHHSTSLPTWLMTPGPVFLRKFVRSSKGEPLLEEVELIESNPSYAHIRYPDGKESSVSLQDLAPCPGSITALQLSSNPALVEGEINESNNREGEPLSTVPVEGREIVSSDALPSSGAVGGPVRRSNWQR